MAKKHAKKKAVKTLKKTAARKAPAKVAKATSKKYVYFFGDGQASIGRRSTRSML